MRLQSLIKNPILAIGALLFIIFIFQAGEKYNWWQSRRQKLMPSSCKATNVKLERRIPANWKSFCEGDNYNNLAININIPSFNEGAQEKNLRKLLYRKLANSLILAAKNSPSDNLERVAIVRMRLNHPLMTINAITEGKYLVKLQSLTDKLLIAEHLKVTVQVKETPKEKSQEKAK